VPELRLENSIVDERYQVDRCLSHGSYAEIFIARDLYQDGLQIIIKALNAFLQGTPEPDLERTLIQNFQNEAIALDKVCHPNIIRRLGHGTASDLEQTPFHYLVLEYMPGGDLLSLCRNHPLGLEESLSYFEQVSAALAYAHSRQVIHRDVKPNNLLLSGDRRVAKIADFGVARIAASQSDEITRVGTNLYAPPEHHPDSQTSELRQSLTPSADVYSLAKTIFTAMTGLSPRHFIREPISSLPDELTRQPWGAGLLAVLNKATSTGVESRYQSVGEFWDAFSGLAATVRKSGAVGDDPEVTVVRSREGGRSNLYGAGGIAAVALATGGDKPVEAGSANGTDKQGLSGTTNRPGHSAGSYEADRLSEQEGGLRQSIPKPIFHPQGTAAPAGDRMRPQKARIVIPLPQPIEAGTDQTKAPPGRSIEEVPKEIPHRQAVEATPGKGTEQSPARLSTAPDAAPVERRTEAMKSVASPAKLGLLDRARHNTRWLDWVRRLFVICMVLALAGFVAGVYLYFAKPDGSVMDVFNGASYRDGAISGAPNVNIHSEPDGENIAALPAGSRIRVLEERNNWTRIKVLHWEGTPPADSPDTGWVHRRFIKLD
jgi:serine/threonine-protein kinase